MTFFMRKYKVPLITFLLCALLLLTCACAVKKVVSEDSSKESLETVEKTDTTEILLDETTETETAPREPEPFVPPAFTNPLTGLGTETDVSKKRPVSIMVNNYYGALPQVGIAHADILYECLAEGEITRLMMISTEYEKLPKVGSIRSAREYYVDYANGYDCIFVNAGGSQDEYSNVYITFAQRGTDRIDGYTCSTYLYDYNGTCTFLRDPERLNKYAYEHTLVIQNGQGLANAVKHYNYRTEKNAGYEMPMNFVDFQKTTTLKNSANHAKVVYSASQIVDYVYSKPNGGYLRYQFNGMPHVDALTDEQLIFENVVVIFTQTAAIPGDPKNRRNITTTGSGSGWYMTDGTYEKITWKKDNYASVLKFYREDGTEVLFNRGKTMINVVPTYNSHLVTFDNNWTDIQE